MPDVQLFEFAQNPGPAQGQATRPDQLRRAPERSVTNIDPSGKNAIPQGRFKPCTMTSVDSSVAAGRNKQHFFANRPVQKIATKQSEMSLTASRARNQFNIAHMVRDRKVSSRAASSQRYC